MAGGQAPAAAAAAVQEPASAGSSFIRSAAQSVGIFLLVQFAMKQFMGGGAKPAANTVASTSGAPSADFTNRPDSYDNGVQFSSIPQVITPMWAKDTPIDLSIYVSPSVIMPPLDSMPKDSLIVQEKGFRYGDYKDKRVIEKIIKVPTEVQHNNTLWAHYLVAQSGAQIDISAQNYDPAKAYQFVRPLTQYLARKKEKRMRSLLSNKNATEIEAEKEEIEAAKAAGPEFANFYHPNITLSFVPESGVNNYPAMHPAMKQFVQLERTGARDASGQNGWYYPILYVNTFWQLRDHMTEVNSTVSELPLRIDLNNVPFWQFSIFASVDEGMKLTREKAARGESVGPGGDGAEFEEFKKILLDSNPYLLGTTFVVSMLHMVFEMLAFKNDVSHWRKKKDNIGTSFRTIVANVVMQTIIFLYLLDNNENTSWMILFSQGMGILIEAWKVTKTVNVRIRQTAPGSILPYSIVFEDKHKLTDIEEKTQEYDQIAFRYMYMIAVPLLIAYATYSLIYDTHKSWYSFIITTLVGSVYAYGFLLMVPSLYINYRLKSVAHMNPRAMMYKFLNTFIDDLFAFTIKMPLLHRLATLRDDVIFFVYIYQSYKYKVDHTRVNEFGQGGDDEEDEKKALTDGKEGEKLDESKQGAKLAASPDGNVDKARAVEELKGEEVTASGSAVQGVEGTKKRRA